MRLPTAGDLDRLVSIERKVVSRDAVYNSEVVKWEPFIAIPGSSPPEPEDLWAQIQDALPSRSENVQQGLAVARNQTRVRLRWIDGVDSSMRVIERDGRQRTLQIVAGPAELGRREFMELVCEEYSS